MALCVPEMCFWPAKSRKNLELFEMHICHWPWAQIWFRHKWRKLASLLLHRIDGYSCLRDWNEFSIFRLNFPRIALWRKRLQWDSKSDLTTTGLFLEIFWSAYASFCRPHVCMDWNLHELINCYSFWRHQIFSIVSSRGILVCSLKMLVLFSHRILYYRALAMHCNFISYVCASSLLALPQVMIDFWQYCITCERR